MPAIWPRRVERKCKAVKRLRKNNRENADGHGSLASDLRTTSGTWTRSPSCSMVPWRFSRKGDGTEIVFNWPTPYAILLVTEENLRIRFRSSCQRIISVLEEPRHAGEYQPGPPKSNSHLADDSPVCRAGVVLLANYRANGSPLVAQPGIHAWVCRSALRHDRLVVSPSLFSFKPRMPTWWGAPLIVVGGLMRLSGALWSYDWLEAGSLLPSLAGLVLLAAGPAVLRWALPAGTLLLFILPWPWQFDQMLTQPLRRVATEASTFTLQTLGVPALARGNRIVVNELEVGVVEACSGLGMLMTFFALSTAVSLVIRRSLTDRVIIFLSRRSDRRAYECSQDHRHGVPLSRGWTRTRSSGVSRYCRLGHDAPGSRPAVASSVFPRPAVAAGRTDRPRAGAPPARESSRANRGARMEIALSIMHRPPNSLRRNERSWRSPDAAL